MNLFTGSIGAWAYVLIAIAAFATMFSTCITAHDALARVSVDILSLLFPKTGNIKKLGFPVAILLLAVVNFMVIDTFSANMGLLIAIATFVSFVVAPILGYMNLRIVTGHEVEAIYRPKKPLRLLTYAGIVFLTFFSLYYCWVMLL